MLLYKHVDMGQAAWIKWVSYHYLARHWQWQALYSSPSHSVLTHFRPLLLWLIKIFMRLTQKVNYMLCAHAWMITATEWLSAMCNVGEVRGGVLGGGRAPPQQKRNHYSVLYVVVLYSVRRAALAMLTPTPSPSKSYFFSVHILFLVCAYLSTGFALWRMVFEMCTRYITIFCFLSTVRAHGAYHRL